MPGGSCNGSWTTYGHGMMATALAYWYFVLPDVATMQTLSWDWALWLYAVNAVGILILYGAVELFYYVKRLQGTRFKYNGKFPAEHPSDVFWFSARSPTAGGSG